MILSLTFLLGLFSCLSAQDTCSNDDCQVNTTECFDGMCLCRPGLFTTTDGSCLSSCSLSDLQNTFVAYPNSNIRGDSNRGLRYEPTLQLCMDQCALTSGCLAFDFRATDGWCQLYNVTALTAPSQWRPKSRPNWTHYQRMCRSSVTSLDYTYNTSCSSDRECSSINGQCILGRCQCASGFLFAHDESLCRLVDSCVAVQRQGGESGVYTILVNQTSPMTVWCDMDSGDGGWLVFQRRRNGSVDFYRNWTQYEAGFGDVTGEFWLGLSKLHLLTNAQSNRMRVDLGEVNGDLHYAEYSSVSVGGPETNYRLTLSGFLGDAGDSLLRHNSMEFSTYDGQHDRQRYENCAIKWHGAWWYNACHESNLNGRYKAGGTYGADGINWYWAHRDSRSFTFTEMKLKPA